MTESGDEGEVVVHDTEVCKLFSSTVTLFISCSGNYHFCYYHYKDCSVQNKNV